MNSTEITTFFEEQKAAALKMALEQEGTSLEQKLQGYLEILYEQLVPTEQQFMIEAQLQMQGERERQMQEMGKRFALCKKMEWTSSSPISSFFPFMQRATGTVCTLAGN